MLYPEELIEEIRIQNDIVDVISGYVRLTKKGNNSFGLCPFHNEKTPSFSVSHDKQIYHCFGCGAGGNVITFIMEYENYSFVEALKFLADRVHIALPEPEVNEEMRKAMLYKQQLIDANREAAKYFYYQLNKDLGKKALEYLNDRGVEPEIRKKFGLGYSPFFRDDLYQYLKGKKFSDSVLVDAGLVIEEKEKSQYHDRFFNRLMFPIFDVHNRVIGFGGRVLGDSMPKYLNSPETKLFDKGKNLYGLNFAKSSRRGFMILAEGYMDVIALHQAGFDNAVASLGTALTPGQSHLLKRYTDEIVISYDGDGAGRNAALKAIGILEASGHTVRVAKMKGYKDPDEVIKNNGKEAYEEILNAAIPSFMFQVEMLEEQYRFDDPESKAKFFQQVANKLVRIDNALKRESYVEAIIQKYRINPKALQTEMEKIGKDIGIATEEKIEIEEAKKVDRKPQSKDAVILAQKNILTIIASHKDIFRAIKPYLKPNEFIDKLYQRVAEIIYKLYDEHEEVLPATIINQFLELDEQKQVSLIFNNSIHVEHQMQFEKMVNESIQILKSAYIDQKSKNITDVADLQELIRLKRELQDLYISLNHG